MVFQHFKSVFFYFHFIFCAYGFCFVCRSHWIESFKWFLFHTLKLITNGAIILFSIDANELDSIVWECRWCLWDIFLFIFSFPRTTALFFCSDLELFRRDIHAAINTIFRVQRANDVEKQVFRIQFNSMWFTKILFYSNFRWNHEILIIYFHSFTKLSSFFCLINFPLHLPDSLWLVTVLRNTNNKKV